MSKYAITAGVQDTPVKTVLYGPEGIGKSTFASHFPDPVFIDTEGGTKRLNVKRLPQPTSWAMLLDEVAEVRRGNIPCGTLVIDTADWAERLCIQAVCAKAKVNGIEDFGYGKGYTYVTERFGKLLNLLSEVCERGCNVVVTAHAIISKFEQPDEMGAYDRWGLKLIDGKKASVAAMLKEWADAVLFANYKTIVITTSKDGKVGKAQGGKNRMLYCSHAATWDAKNRWGLPDEVPMEYQQLAPFIPVPQLARQQPQVQKQAVETVNVSTVTPEQIEQARNIPDPFEPERPAYLKPLYDLMQRDGISAETVSEAIFKRGYFPEGTPVDSLPEDFANFLVAVWDGMREYINSGMAAGRKE